MADTPSGQEMPPRNTSSPGPEQAARLFAASIAATAVGIFLGIFLLFIDPVRAVLVALVVLVGIVGILSFFRHTVFFRSDQARMGWAPDHPQFQMEVGYANLAIGITALASAVFSWGMTAAAVSFFTYGLYLLGALAVHIRDVRQDPSLKKRKMPSIVNTGIFVFFLILFGAVALTRA
jgi:F0F1-type ATP synthase assembly protein I